MSEIKGHEGRRQGFIYFYFAALIKGPEATRESQLLFILNKPLQFILEWVERREDKIDMPFWMLIF